MSSELLENLHVYHKRLTQSKNGVVTFDFKMKLGSTFVKRYFERNLLYLTAVVCTDREYTAMLKSYSASSFTESFDKTAYFVRLRVSDLTSTFISSKSIDLCIGGKLNDKIINGFFTFFERFFSDVNSW